MTNRIGVMTLAAAMVACFSASASAADAAKGEALAEAQCADCHEVADWEGESADALATQIKDIVAGKTKHKTKLKLTDDEMKAVAAYWSGAK